MDKEFWENQAKGFEYDVKAVNFDPIGEELEFAFLDKVIRDDELVCDVGCGNGRTIIELSQKFKNTKFYGMDFSTNMINIANKKKDDLKLENVNFEVCDALSADLPEVFNIKFDKVLTKRLLINVKGKDKLNAIKNVHSILKDNGIYVMTECFIEPLNRINSIRKSLDLAEIKVKHFNEYLTADFIPVIENYFVINEKIDFMSLYYFISRVYNAYLTEGEPDYFAPINMLSAKLIKSGIDPIEGYSPEVTYLLEKKD